MTTITVLSAITHVLPERKYNLCEVCFKPFNLANIDMHLEAGCAAEIKERYKFVSEPSRNQENYVDKLSPKKICKQRTTLTVKKTQKKLKTDITK